MKALTICLFALSKAEQVYYASDCIGELRDLGLNPIDYHRKVSIVYIDTAENVATWHQRHLAKFDTTLFEVINL